MGRSALPRLFAALLATAPFVLLPGARDFANLPQTAWLQTGVCALLLLYVNTPRDAARPFDSPLRAVGAWSLLSGLWAHNRYEWCEDLLLLATGLVVYFLASRVLDADGDRRWFVGALVIAGGLIAIIGLAQYVFGFGVIPQVSSPAATFASRNVAASVAVVLFPAAAAVALYSDERRAAIVSAGVAALLLAFTFHTAVRSAWLAMIVEMIALVVAVRCGRRRVERWRAGLLVGALVAAALLASLGPLGFTSPAAEIRQLSAETVEGPSVAAESVEAADKTRSVSLRLAVWRDSLRMIVRHPLRGVGLGNFKVQFPAEARSTLMDAAGRPFLVDYAHNEYLQAVAETGLIGAALLGWLFVHLVPRVSSAIRAPSDPAALVAATGLVGLAVDSAFSFPLHRAVTASIGAAFLGLLSDPVRPTAPSAGPPRRALSVVLAVVMAFVAAWSAVRIAADRHLRRMTLAADAGDWDGAAREGAAARRLNPFRSLASFPWASAEIHRERYREAIAILEALVRDYPYHASAWGNLAIAHLGAGDRNDARLCFERVLALQPDDALAREQLQQLGPGITR